MVVYFDTNVYNHISQAGDEALCSTRLRQIGAAVVASAENLFEMYAIPDAAARDQEIRTLTSVAHRFEAVPSSYREAMEVRCAVARHRPDWTRRVVFDRLSRNRRADHVRRWQDGKVGILPDATALAAYRRDFEAGTRQTIAFQKALRRAKVNEEKAIILKTFGDKVGAVTTDLARPDAFWRSECWFAYDGALVQRNPATRDLYDWLSPHLKMERVTTEELFLFWMRDVTPSEVPRAMWSGLVAWGQLHAKTSHGNPNDQQHAAMALSTDLFVTADAGLHRALDAALQHWSARAARIMLWPRGASVGEAMDALAAEASACRAV